MAIRPFPCLKIECFDGGRACPPEDCGGPGGYEHLLEVITDSKHEEHEDMHAWFKSMVPRGHLTEVFPIAKVNKVLSKGLKSLVEHYDVLAGLYSDGCDEEDADEDEDGKAIRFPSRN